MGYKTTFMDNEVYSAQDINEHFARLFSGGVSLLESGNILADLNSMTEEMVESGVLYDACLVVKTADGYKISAGTAYMNDGSAITFDKDGYTFTAEAGVNQYVYLKRNEPENSIDIVVSAEEPDADAVLLAEITAGGGVLDRRTYSRLKLNTYQAGTMRDFEVSIRGSDEMTIDIGRGEFSYIYAKDSESYHYDDAMRTWPSGKNLLEIADGETISFNYRYGGNSACYTLYLQKNGHLLDIRVDSYSSYYSHKVKFAVI